MLLLGFSVLRHDRDIGECCAGLRFGFRLRLRLPFPGLSRRRIWFHRLRLLRYCRWRRRRSGLVPFKLRSFLRRWPKQLPAEFPYVFLQPYLGVLSRAGTFFLSAELQRNKLAPNVLNFLPAESVNQILHPLFKLVARKSGRSDCPCYFDVRFLEIQLHVERYLVGLAGSFPDRVAFHSRGVYPKKGPSQREKGHRV